jgi:hypothetical protein
MLNLKIDNKIVKIPESYSEISLKDFCSIWKILDEFKPHEAEEDKELTDDQVIENASREYDMTIKLVSFLCDLTDEQTKQISYDQATNVVSAFNHLVSNERLNNLEGKQADHFIWEGEAYYFPKMGFDTMKFGEYAELMQMQQIYGKTPAARFDFLNKQIALSCRKFKEEKDSYNIEEREKIFELLPMNIVMQWTFFLTNQIKTFSRNIQTYTQRMEKQGTNITEKQSTLLKAMGGLTQSTNLLEKEFLPSTQ